MTNTKDENDLKSILKIVRRLPTEKKVRSIVNEVIINFSHTILKGVELLLENYSTKNDIEGLKADLSDTVSKRKFYGLQRKVSRLAV